MAEDVNPSRFRIRDANITGCLIDNDDLTGLTILDSQLDGMTVDSVNVEEMLAAYRRGTLRRTSITSVARHRRRDTGIASVGLLLNRRRPRMPPRKTAGLTFPSNHLKAMT